MSREGGFIQSPKTDRFAWNVRTANDLRPGRDEGRLKARCPAKRDRDDGNPRFFTNLTNIDESLQWSGAHYP